MLFSCPRQFILYSHCQSFIGSLRRWVLRRDSVLFFISAILWTRCIPADSNHPSICVSLACFLIFNPWLRQVVENPRFFREYHLDLFLLPTSKSIYPVCSVCGPRTGFFLWLARSITLVLAVEHANSRHWSMRTVSFLSYFVDLCPFCKLKALPWSKTMYRLSWASWLHEDIDGVNMVTELCS